jgi:DTW domain-containing protein YfiP
MTAKKFPLPKRFNAGLSEKAYKHLRKLNKKYHYGNNYILTLILENSEAVLDAEALDKVFKDFEREYGSPRK